MDYKDEIKERLNNLPERLRNFVLQENWRREAERIGQQFHLDEEKYASFENEIFLTLLCFETRSDFVENLKSELGLDVNTAGQLADGVNRNIFSQVSEDLDTIDRQITENEPTEQEENQNQGSNRVGQSFEQIILNQARAMQPARPAGGPAQAPENLPTQPEVGREIHNYTAGTDPYREPLE